MSKSRKSSKRRLVSGHWLSEGTSAGSLQTAHKWPTVKFQALWSIDQLLKRCERNLSVFLHRCGINHAAWIGQRDLQVSTGTKVKGAMRLLWDCSLGCWSVTLYLLCWYSEAWCCGAWGPTTTVQVLALSYFLMLGHVGFKPRPPQEPCNRFEAFPWMWWAVDETAPPLKIISAAAPLV